MSWRNDPDRFLHETAQIGSNFAQYGIIMSIKRNDTKKLYIYGFGVYTATYEWAIENTQPVDESVMEEHHV